MSLWVCLSFTTVGGRVAGPVAVALLLPSCFLLADRVSGQWVAGLRYAALALGVVACVEASWVSLAPGVSGWLHPSAACLTVLTLLAVLAVLGVLAGIQLRVRAFLFMGLTFLCLDVFAMIRHAAVDRTQTWVWYLSGIVLGGAILALFALFEKRRNDVLQLLEEIKRWD